MSYIQHGEDVRGDLQSGVERRQSAQRPINQGAHPPSVQRQCVTPPGRILPPSEVRKQLGAARLPDRYEILEPQLLEAAAKPAAVLQLARDQQPLAPRGEAGELHIPLLRIIGAR